MLSSWSENESHLYIHLNCHKNAKIYLFDTHLKVYHQNKKLHVLFHKLVYSKTVKVTNNSDKASTSIQLEKQIPGVWGNLEAKNKKQLWQQMVLSEEAEDTSFNKQDEDEQHALFIKQMMKANRSLKKDKEIQNVSSVQFIEEDYDKQLDILDVKITKLLNPLKDIPIRSSFKL